jgi:hypothetical protein
MMHNTREDEVTPQAGTDESLTFEIVQAIATECGIDPLEMRPLQEHVDLEALDQLLQSASTARHIMISFQYEEHVVQVNGDGTVDVSSSTAPEPNSQQGAEE